MWWFLPEKMNLGTVMLLVRILTRIANHFLFQVGGLREVKRHCAILNSKAKAYGTILLSSGLHINYITNTKNNISIDKSYLKAVFLWPASEHMPFTCIGTL